MTRILQGNLNRSSLAQDLLHHRTFEDKIGVCIISEQYKNPLDTSWHTDKTSTAAIWITNRQVVPTDSGRGDGYVWIKTAKTYNMSVYLSPNEGISAFRQKLADIESTICGFDSEIIVAGDFNAKSAE